jgi:hypothetical protein
MKKTLAIFLLLAFAISSCESLLFNSHVTPAPTPQCIQPTLTLGALNYRIEPVTRPANSFPNIPKRKKDVAYWVEDTTVNYVFALSPTKDNLALNSVLKAGDPAIISWADCSKDEYTVKSVETAQTNDLKLFDQSTGGLTIYVQTNDSALVIHGERPLAQPAETAAATSENTTQLNIQFSDLTPPDDKSVKIGLEITNEGSQTITLTNQDISLTSDNNAEVFPLITEPALPQDIPPGGTLSMAVTFPKPAANSAVLRIINLTFDYYL